ncbi:MAG: Na+/H+ antiporter subunit E [Gammaproteobacteria bacterium]|nr:Na+/H+ antiporter subunit E [Gammaproteobacteria bacterium]MBL6998946.1 Na+/H+ antiporter subunit E [Gammaproteobacteria bacterium]
MRHTTDTRRPVPWRSILFRGLLFSLIWWSLSNGVAASWWVGVPAVLLALISSLYLLPPMTMVWSAWLKFIPFFISRSLHGGIDVARRAFHPALPLAPDIINIPLRLRAGLARVFMINTINLLPGTLSVSIDQNQLRIHVLDRHQDFMSEILQVEEYVSRLFGIPLQTADQGE